MRLLVGLGNPGEQHAAERHNVGFMALDAIAREYGMAALRPRSRFSGDVAEGTVAGARIIALKPTTYMNESGRAVGAAAKFHKLAPEDIIVLHDELDLAPGKVRVKLGGGNAGHNGLKSVAAHVGGEFWRVRIGIGHPGNGDIVQRHVLGNFAKADADWLNPMLAAMADAMPLLLKDDAGAFMTRVAHLAPAPSSALDAADSADKTQGEGE